MEKTLFELQNEVIAISKEVIQGKNRVISLQQSYIKYLEEELNLHKIIVERLLKEKGVY